MRAGTILVVAGLVIAGVGAVIRWAPWLVSWFGNLPGDIQYRGENTTVFVPLTSMILISIGVSLVLALVRRLGS